MAASAGHAVAYTIGSIFEISEMFNCWERRWIDVNGASHTLSGTMAIFSAGLWMGMPVSFTFFSQDNDYMELMVLLFFQNPYAIFAHILQHYHDFQSNVTIFPSVVQAYTQPYSFGGRRKLIICQIKHELNVTIHEISTNWQQKNVRWRILYKLNLMSENISKNA